MNGWRLGNIVSCELSVSLRYGTFSVVWSSLETVAGADFTTASRIALNGFRAKRVGRCRLVSLPT